VVKKRGETKKDEREDIPDAQKDESAKHIPGEDISLQLSGSSPYDIILTTRIDNLNQKITSRYGSGSSFVWDQLKINKLLETSKQYQDEYGVYIDPRIMLAIIFAEGTGSFNTNPQNAKQYNGYGPEENFDVDIKRAYDLIVGKSLGYIYYKEGFNQAVLEGANSQGDVFQYYNWNTPIIDVAGQKLRSGVYATDMNWSGNVSSIYNQLAGDAASEEFNDYIESFTPEWAEKISNSYNIDLVPKTFIVPEKQ
jgi:hypothetical protein